MKNISFTRLSARLILLVLAVIVPMLGLIVYHGIEGRNRDRHEALNDTRRLALNAATLYEHAVIETRQLLFTLSLMPIFHQQDSAACSKIFADLLKETENYTGFSAAKPNGEVFASAPTMTKPVNFADRPWFQRLVQTRSFVIGEYLVGRISGKSTVILGYPVLDHTGQLMAVFNAGLDLERLQQKFTIDLPAGANLNVIDSDGTILLRYPDPDKFTGKKMPESSIVKTILTQKKGSEEGVGLDGVPRLYGYTTVGSGMEAIHISVGIPEQVAYAAAKRNMVINFTFWGLISVLTLLGARLFGKMLIISPVNRLIDMTKRLTEGDLTVRTGQSVRTGELGLLSTHFDQMAGSLQRREEALQASEEKYRLAFQNVSDVIFSYDREFRILAISPSVERVLGYKPEEFIGKTFPELNIIPPEYLEKAFSETMRVFAGEVILSSIYEFIARDGTRKYGEINSTPLHRDGQVVAVVSVARDITERKRAEEQLYIKDIAMGSAITGIAMAGLDEKLTYINTAWLRMFGYDSVAEVLGTSPFDHVDSSPTDAAAIISTIKGAGYWVGELRCRRHDGSLFHAELACNLVSDVAGQPLCLLASFQDTSERKLSEERLKRQLDNLAALRTIDMAITASLDIRVTFNVFLEQVVACLGVDAADVLTLNSQSYNKLSFVAGRGFSTDALRYTSLPLGVGFAGRVAQERKTIFIANLEKEAENFLKKSPVLHSENFVSYCGTPLIAKGQVKGVLEIFNRTLIEPEQEWLDFLEALAMQGAIAMDNAKLFNDLQESNLELIQAYDNTLEGWSNALDLRDKETEGHSQRVTDMTLRLAHRLGMRDSELVHVRRGALLHDIGKMGIPDGILLKPGPLNDEEWEIMRKHTEYAYELLYPISYLRPAVDIPYCHHEKWDGTGYPRGLKGEHIPLAAKIFAIVDVWDALRSERPYRPAWPEEKTIEHIKEQSGKHFDPKVAEAFIELLDEFKPV